MVTKDSLIKGTIILALAAFTARFLGVIQRVPLKHLLEDAGMATYGIAYNIYAVLLLIATAGIPSALSKLVSERIALGNEDEAQRIYRAAVWFALTAGLIMTMALWFSAEFYAVHISRDADATLAIRALAPALLIFPLIAIMRGYFQGRQMMIAGGLSQIVEQILRVVTAVGLAFILLYFGFSKKWAVAGASFGGVMGAVGALVVMIYFWRKLSRRDQTTVKRVTSRESVTRESALSYTQIYKMIFKLSIPISLISMAVPMIYLIDSSTVIALLEGQLGYHSAKETLGILTGRAQAIAGIPPIIGIAVSQSIVPIISSAYAQRDMVRVNDQSSQALRLAILFSMPVILLLCITAQSVNGFLFGDVNGTGIIVVLVAGSLLQILMLISGAILMGLGQIKAPMIHVFIGLVIKFTGSCLFASWLGIYGIILATILCFAVITILNLKYLRKTVHFHVFGWKWLTMCGVVLLLTGLGSGILSLSMRWIELANAYLTYGIHMMNCTLVILPLYLLLILRTRLITEADVSKLPVRIQKIVKLFCHTKIKK